MRHFRRTERKMNRVRKVRGHNRIQKRIRNWIEQNKSINIDDFLANKFCYTYISFEPYFNISINKKGIPEPKSNTRKCILLGLEEIYNNWKSELDKLNQPYFLKIFLFEPRLSRSQVVCAIGKEKIEYYENYFRRDNKKNKTSNFNTFLSKDFRWQIYTDDEVYIERELLNPELHSYLDYDYKTAKKILRKVNKQNIPKIMKKDDFEIDYLFHFRKGSVLIGGK